MGVVTPSVPASGVDVYNETGQFVSVDITGGTMTDVSVNGTSKGTGAGVYQLPPGGYITLTYSVAPTSWTWANPIDVGYTPGATDWPYNKLAETSGYDPLTILPYPQHATLAQSGLATAVSN